MPGAFDDAYFDAASGVVTVTKTSVSSTANLNFSGFTGTFGGTSTTNVFGNLTISASMTWNHSGSVQITGTTVATITSNGNVIKSNIVVEKTSSGSVSLNDALNNLNTLTVTSGTFTTNDYAVTALQLLSSNSNTRTINLGSSTITFTGATGVLFFQVTTGLTINPGTSTITCSGNGPQIIFGSSGAPLAGTLYNLNLANTTAGSIPIIRGNLTLNNLTVAAPASAGVINFQIEGNQTINGTLSTTGTAGNRRVWFRSQTYGLAQTITVNSTPSLTDADFRDIYVVGSAAPISGTRIGDLRGCRGIEFSAPKTVYWNRAAGGDRSTDSWAATSGGGVSTDNFPLAQDTEVIENTGLNTSATVRMDGALPYAGTVDLSARTNAMTFSTGAGYTIYGDFRLASAVTMDGTWTGRTYTFSGRNTQSIVSAGKTTAILVVDSYGGTVELADALNIGSTTLTVTNGTLDTKGYAVTAGNLSSNNINVRTITLGSSTVTLSGAAAINLGATNLIFNCGTSSIILSGNNISFSPNGQVFYDVSFTSSSATISTINNAATFNNLSITATATAGLRGFVFSENQTINGTLTCTGASPTRRIFVRSNTLGTTRTLTVNSLSADDCDFRDITIAGTAAGSSPTRAGDCGGNTGITFPAPKTVYWNLTGTQVWSATAWASSSGGTPDINNFPLAQDTAVFDDAGAAGTVTVQTGWNIGTFDASARASAAQLNAASACRVYGNWLWGTGFTANSSGAVISFSGRSAQTITSNGVSFNNQITIDCFTGTVQLADALTLNSVRTLTLTSGTFDAVTYNVTTGLFSLSSNSLTKTVKLGSGTWTLYGTGSIWNVSTTAGLTFYKGTANIVLSDTSTSARTFVGSGQSYNKLTIGGATGTSTLTITGNNQFTELASTKTVAHTIALGSTTQTFGKWSVTGTVGNVVTVTGTGTGHILAGSCTIGIDYLAMGSIGFAATSPGEFYAGANSSGTNVTIIKTAAPTPVTRYWVGGTGTWDATTTTKWSDSSGGAGGFSVPTSADAVVFDSASNATAYTVTCTATQLRCGSLTFSPPASGNVTWAGTAPLAVHDDLTLPATGMTRTYTGDITLSGSSTGGTLTPNGNVLASQINVNGVNCEWALGGAATTGPLVVINGSFDTDSYSFSVDLIRSDVGHTRSISLGSSVLTFASLGSFPIDFGTTETNRANLTFSAGTSQINDPRTTPVFKGNNQTFYNYSFTSTAIGTVTINGANTFNNLSVTGITAAGLKTISVTADQTINGTLTLSAGTDATMRHFVRSDTLGTTRTLTCAVVAATDTDFRDITIAGAATPVSGTRIGDCKGNSGITFDAAANKYWNLAAGGNWGGAVAWATSSGGTPAVNNFPLAQDACVFEATGLNSGATVTINAAYNIGTIDMSARTTNTMTLATGSEKIIYGNWINGTGTTLTGTGQIRFSGRSSQTITSAGATFTQNILTDSPNGTVKLTDAFITNRSVTPALGLINGTFDADGYNVTLTGAASGITLSGSATLVFAVGSGTWIIAGTGGWNATTSTNLTVTGTGTISLTSASSKTFAGGGIDYSGITLDQNGAGTLTITGNNTFADITNSYSATGATTIALGTTTQRVGAFSATGTIEKVLTVTGTSASSPATLIFTNTGQATTASTDYLTITGVRAYSLDSTWYAGANSTNNGSLGWYFESSIIPVGGTLYFNGFTITEMYFGSTAITSAYYGSIQVI